MQQAAGGGAKALAATQGVAHFAHAEAELVVARARRRNTVRGGVILQHIQQVQAVQVRLQFALLADLQQALHGFAATEPGQFAQHVLAQQAQLAVVQGGHGGGVAVPGGQCLQQGRVVLRHHVQGVAGPVGHAAAGNVQLQVPGRGSAAVQAAAFNDARGKGVVFAIGGHLQAQVVAGGGVSVQHLAEHRLPLLEELLVAEIGIHAVQQRLRLALAQRGIQRLGEATEARVAGIAKPEYRIAQAAQRRAARHRGRGWRRRCR
ncbi:hypothetical protein G6F57_017813 [Rhizopus arrhizus]|nr:hypothetical protein G6F57_017813 [Rhizopus arrhizus]